MTYADRPERSGHLSVCMTIENLLHETNTTSSHEGKKPRRKKKKVVYQTVYNPYQVFSPLPYGGMCVLGTEPNMFQFEFAITITVHHRWFTVRSPPCWVA